MPTSAILTPLLPLGAADPLEHVIDHPIWAPGGWYVLTNHMIMMFIAAGLMLLIFPFVTKKYRQTQNVPAGRTHNLFEALMIFIRDDVAKPVLAEHTHRFIPFLWTLFFFILFCNLLGLLPLEPITGPIMHAIDEDAHAIYGTATANIWVTGSLALFSFILWQVAGIREQGVVNWAKHFLGGAPWYMAPVMVPVEILGMFVKPFALAIRLFANMTAGHVLLAVLIGFVALVWDEGVALAGGVGFAVILGSVAINLLELFVAFLQAYIFTFLTALFIGQLVVHEHDDHEEHGPGHEAYHSKDDLTDSAELSQYGVKTEPAIH